MREQRAIAKALSLLIDSDRPVRTIFAPVRRLVPVVKVGPP